MKSPRSPTSREAAEVLAVRILGHLAADPERIGRFLALTGIGPETLRAAAREPGFLITVLDHVLFDDAGTRAAAEATGVTPEAIAAARRVLDPAPHE